MRVHHLSCGSFRPPCRLLLEGRGALLGRCEFVVHCLLVEQADCLVLVDTGLSRADSEAPLRRLGPVMAWAGGVAASTSALEHVTRLGHRPGDVRHILMTHLDKDHAGGLADFPHAKVHLHKDELLASTRRSKWIERQRYSPKHFFHRPNWAPLPGAWTQEWFGLAAHRIEGLPETVLMVYLPGHSAGHCGVAIHDGQRWLLQCGDAVYHRAWLDGGHPAPAMQFAEFVMQHNGLERAESRRRLLHILQNHSDEVEVFNSHDLQAFLDLGGVQ